MDVQNQWLYEELKAANAKIRRQQVLITAMAMVIMIAVFYFLISYLVSSPSEPVQEEQIESAVVVPEPEPIEEEKPEPHPVNYRNGQILRYPSAAIERICPLSVTASPWFTHYIYVDFEGKDKDMAFLVAPGETAEVDVPVGWARIYYAIGEEWRGNVAMFGPDTHYYKTDSAYNFTVEGDQALGYEIELIQQPGGNLDSDPIEASDFPGVGQ